MINVTFTCEHVCALTGNEVRPLCKVCGELRIARVDAPAPTFTGHARGPCATFQDLAPKAVNFAISSE